MYILLYSMVSLWYRNKILVSCCILYLVLYPAECIDYVLGIIDNQQILIIEGNSWPARRTGFLPLNVDFINENGSVANPDPTPRIASIDNLSTLRMYFWNVRHRLFTISETELNSKIDIDIDILYWLKYICMFIVIY